MNITLLTGNLTREPEKVENIKEGTLCRMTLAVNETYTKNDGTRAVSFFNVMVWNKPAENCLKYLHKGSKVAVAGRMQQRSWENEKGERKYATELVATEIEFISTPKNDNEKSKESKELTPVDDELPF